MIEWTPTKNRKYHYTFQLPLIKLETINYLFKRVDIDITFHFVLEKKPRVEQWVFTLCVPGDDWDECLYLGTRQECEQKAEEVYRRIRFVA